ncbi:hypothetical protein M752DRAFT_288442 [Aspergillus phoenicis ATCC 13157]|uniref:Uncharacterized protein n=1 Tax=Aspergillus phoenicis ATCC 13157 TaxID=1353007 RepID=A0A370Q0K9_ASPPH|nr:hypothetical protein M752DRAFT_288442 [Aspergillus phoenicis ATCC 13157]
MTDYFTATPLLLILRMQPDPSSPFRQQFQQLGRQGYSSGSILAVNCRLLEVILPLRLLWLAWKVYEA